ncbi:MAG: serine/threonine protein kinase [Polyangiaceae bacterium]|nr:serine/threonine protein kinase [Polyangiaceae bacterium]
MQRDGSAGTTTTSRAKALLLCVEHGGGRAEANAFLAAAGIERDHLDDETRPLGLERWHGSLVAFVQRRSRGELATLSRFCAHAENLGAWTRVLRGAPSPEAAYRQLERHGGDELVTDAWETLEVGPGRWVGQVVVPFDAPRERDGLCLLAREAEVAAVPRLFGLAPARVQHRLVRDDKGRALARFEARWQATLAPVLVATGGVGGGTGGTLIALSAGGTQLESVVAVLAGVAVGATAGALASGELRRRSESRAQLVRIQALERDAALRESRGRGGGGLREGNVLAGRYRLRQPLGSGASGAIWEALRLADARTVAIKVLRTAVAHDTVAADRLRREAAALGLAWHPNVVEILDDGHLADGTAYLVMERLYGESLASRLRRVGPLPDDVTIAIALELADALGAVHAAGVVHRDLKPSNIFLARAADDRAGPTVKLLDFGVARIEWAETRITNVDAPLGTPGYMPPEQEEGREVDARADVFAFGGVLHECVTGEPPPVRTSQSRQRVGPATTGPPSAPAPVSRELAPHWRELVERAMAPDPRSRFPTARELRAALVALRDTLEAGARAS